MTLLSVCLLIVLRSHQPLVDFPYQGSKEAQKEFVRLAKLRLHEKDLVNEQKRAVHDHRRFIAEELRRLDNQIRGMQAIRATLLRRPNPDEQWLKMTKFVEQQIQELEREHGKVRSWRR